MTIETRFSAPKEVQPLNGTSAIAVGANRDAKRNEGNFNDWGKVVNDGILGGGKLSAQIASNKNAAAANSAKADYVEFISSEEYLNATDTFKVEMYDKKYASIQHQDETYKNAFKGYSVGAYSQSYSRMNEELRLSQLNAAGAEYTSWKEADSNVVDEDFNFPGEEPEYKINGDIYDASTWIDMKHNIDPRLGKVELGQALLNDGYIQMELDVSSARSPAELQTAIANHKEIKSGFNSDFLLNNKGSQAVQANNKREASLQNAIKLKNKEFILEVKNTIESKPYMTDAEVEPKAKFISMDKDTGKLDLTKYNTAMEEYTKRREDLYQKNTYDADVDITKTTDVELLKNPEIKKKHLVNVTKGLEESFTFGDEIDFNRTVQANADYLKEYKTKSMSFLFNDNVDKEDQDLAWGNMNNFLQSEGGVASMRSIYGKDLARIQGVLLLQRTTGIDRETAIARIQKWKDNPDQTTVTKDANFAIADLNKDYGPLQDEFKTLVEIQIAGGVDPEQAVDSVSELMDENITTIGGVPSFKIAGDIVKVSDNAEDMYDEIIQTRVDEIVESNAGNPIQFEVLNDGQVIARDATWGWKIKGSNIDTKLLAKQAEDEAVRKGPTTPQKLSTFVESKLSNTVTGVGGVASNVIEGTSTVLSEGLKGLSKQVDVTTDALYNLFVTTSYKEAQKKRLNNPTNNQSDISKKIIEEEGVSISGGSVIPNISIDTTQLGEAETKELQKAIGVTPDGTFGNTSKKALNFYERNMAIANQIEDMSASQVHKLAEIESPNKGYTDYNKGSDAYGRYQFIPSTAYEYAKDLGYTGKAKDLKALQKFMTPDVQDQMFINFTANNINGLKDRGIPVTMSTIYGAHQQGLDGITSLLKDSPEKMTKTSFNNLISNTGYTDSEKEKLKKMFSDKEVVKAIRDNWFDYWDKVLK